MWSLVWPLLLTALLTLAVTLSVQLVVQFYAVPRVETRKRREDRWERDLLALGEILAFDQPAAADALFHEIWWRSVIEDYRELGLADDEKLAEMTQVHEERIREVTAEYRRIDARIDWLADRIKSVAPNADGLKAFDAAYGRYFMAYVKTTMLAADRPEADDAQEDSDPIRKVERDAVHGIVTEIKGLVGSPPPTKRLVRRSHTPGRAARRETRTPVERPIDHRPDGTV